MLHNSQRDNIIKKPDENIDDDNSLHQLQKLFTFLQISSRNAVNPKDFVYSFKDSDNLPTDINVQCDAQEFLSRFMDKIEFSLDNAKNKIDSFIKIIKDVEIEFFDKLVYIFETTIRKYYLIIIIFTNLNGRRRAFRIWSSLQ